MTQLARHLSTTGKTQRWLAAQVGVRPATVCAWCKGYVLPRPEHMQRISEVTDGQVPVTAWFPPENQEDAA